jgi:hypothetical protein
LALGVQECLGLGATFLLLQTSTLTKRRAHDTAALLADPTAIVGDLLLALRREFVVFLVAIDVVARLPTVWPSKVRILTHSREYRCFVPDACRANDIDRRSPATLTVCRVTASSFTSAWRGTSNAS